MNKNPEEILEEIEDTAALVDIATNLHRFDEPEKDCIILALVAHLNKESRRQRRIESVFSGVSGLLLLICFLLLIEVFAR